MQQLSYYAKTLSYVLFLVISVNSSSVYAGDVTGDLNTTADNNSNINSNNNTDSTTNNYNATGAGQAAPVMSSVAPTVMGGGGNDSCLIPRSTGIQLSVVGLSSGAMEQDEACNRRKNARLLGLPQQTGGLGLQVSAISVLCQDAVVFKSMMLANTPCPIIDIVTGRLLMGKDALYRYREQPTSYIVGYEEDKEFWDTLLRVGEDLTDEQQEAKQLAKSTAPKLSLSDRFRSSKRRDTVHRGSEDTEPDQLNRPN